MQTDKWAIDAILKCEILTHHVVDPCCGDGRMAEAAHLRGHDVFASDKYDWGYNQFTSVDFLGPYFNWPGAFDDDETTVFMNPPFSLACKFVDRALELGARKVVCFQRQVWRESRARKAWFEAHPYNRRWICGDRATCWYGTIPEDRRDGGQNQPHAWYVWERGHPPGALEGTIWKDK